MHDSSNIQFRIVDSFFRHRWLFTLCLTVVTLVALGVFYFRSRGYNASGLIWASPDALAQSLGRDTQRAQWTTLAQVNTNRFRDMINDDLPGGFLDRALRRADLSRPMSVDPRARDRRLALLLQNLHCDTRSDEVFAISLTWNNPAECERIVKALRDEYLEVASRKQQSVLKGTRAFLDGQIKNYERRMRTAEQALISFKQTNLGDSPEAGAATIRQLAELRRQLDELTITSRDADLRREALRNRMQQIKPTSILEQTVGDDPRVRKLRELETERALQLAQFKPASDEIQAVDSQIAALKASLEAEQHSGQNVLETKLQDNPEFQVLNQQLTDAEIERKTRTSQMQLLRRQILDYMERVQRFPARERLLTDRTRSYNILKTQYESLLRQREEAEIQGDLQAVTAPVVLDRIGAVIAEWATSKKKLALMALGSVALGIAFALVMVILSEWLDPSLRYEEDAERLLGVPVLITLHEVSASRLRPGPSMPTA